MYTHTCTYYLRLLWKAGWVIVSTYLGAPPGTLCPLLLPGHVSPSGGRSSFPAMPGKTKHPPEGAWSDLPAGHAGFRTVPPGGGGGGEVCALMRKSKCMKEEEQQDSSKWVAGIPRAKLFMANSQAGFWLQ